jgi:hypothetical protein
MNKDEKNPFGEKSSERLGEYLHLSLVAEETSSNKLTLSLSVVLVTILLIGGYLWWSQPWESTPPLLSSSGCTLEAKECPDGSFVSREGPNCEFVDCPITKNVEGFCFDNCGTLVQPNNTPASDITFKSIVLGNFRGYYQEEEAYTGLFDIPDEEKDLVTCRQLVITEGHPGLIGYFVNYISEGNRVNTISSDGYLTVNLPWREFSDTLQNQIKNSSLENPMDILLYKEYLEGHAFVCESFFTTFDPFSPRG